MPILLHVDDLRPGMRLMQAVQRDQQTMLTGGKILEEWEVTSLRRRFPNLWVQVGDPVLDEWVQFQDDSKDHEVAISVSRRLGDLMTNVREKLGAKTALDASDITGLQRTIIDVLEYINKNPVTTGLLIRCAEAGNYLQSHVANVFYISLLVGNTIRDYVYRERQRYSKASMVSTRYGMNLTPLALGCLFHDLGMIPLEHLYTQEGSLCPQDQRLVREHPDIGAEMLPKGFDAVARMVVRTHHENFDSTGYPKGIPSESLHVFSRVIRAADALDAGTSDRIYKKAKSTARVLWEMSAGPTEEHYDPTIVKIMMGLVQPFAIGAKVRLDCGRYGVVVRHNRKHPFRPRIIIAFDEEGRKLKKSQLEPPIDLAHNHQIRIVEFAGDDLSCLNEAPDDDVWGRPEVSDEEMEQTLFEFSYP